MLDLDATDDPVHGAQEGRFFHGCYVHYCYLPFDKFAGEHLRALTVATALMRCCLCGVTATAA